MYRDYQPYLSVAARRAKGLAQLEKRGLGPLAPVVIEGRRIATTFWGTSWNENLESYSDYASRLPRGRTYVKNGSVANLRLEAGTVEAHVIGSELYTVDIDIEPMSEKQWATLCADCSGSIDSLVELLQGQFSDSVMKRLCEQGRGLFPTPEQIEFRCSCPDSAYMCKHIAAVLYGIGARLDHSPQLLFTLRKVQLADLIASANPHRLASSGKARRSELKKGELSALFGIELGDAPSAKKRRSKRK